MESKPAMHIIFGAFAGDEIVFQPPLIVRQHTDEKVLKIYSAILYSTFQGGI